MRGTMALLTYQYDFRAVSEGHLRGLRLTGSRGPDPLLFEAELAPALLAGRWKGLNPIVQDFLDLVPAVMATDRLSWRRPDCNGNGWERRLQVEMPVRVPDFWKQNRVTDRL